MAEHRLSPLPTVRSNFVDRFIEIVAPVHAARRLHARASMAAFGFATGGGYVSGRTDRKSMQEFRPWPGSANEDINPGLSTIRARSRDLVRNAPLATGAVNTTVTGVIGSGLAAKPAPDRTFLGLSEDGADQWESRARKLWELWAETAECDIEAELNFYDLEDLAFRSTLESGDALAVHRFVERPGSMFATRVQLVEADRISNPQHQIDSPQLTQGITVDSEGRTTGYWVQDGHPGDLRILGRGGNWTNVTTYSDTGMRRAWLLFHKRRIGQRRGVPYLAPVIEPFKQLERYTEAELMGALVAAMFTVFIKSERGSGPEISGIDGAEPGARGELSLGTGLVAELLEGESIETANPTRPNSQFDPFVTSIARQAGVALELPYELVIKHFSSSYSASRAALLEAWRFFRHRREWVAGHFCTPAYEAVMTESVSRGWLDAPGFFDDPLVRAAWLGVQWTGDSMPQLDPLKEVNAAAKRVEEGFSTRQRESMELTSTDWEQNHRQREKEERLRREAGFVSSNIEPSVEPEEAEVAA